MATEFHYAKWPLLVEDDAPWCGYGNSQFMPRPPSLFIIIDNADMASHFMPKVLASSLDGTIVLFIGLGESQRI